MARFVTFGGQTQFKPGGLTKVDATGLTPIGLSATGIVQLLGEADGGQPGSEGVVVVDDPALGKSLFRSGSLADAIKVAFNPSGDARIPGGAFRCLCYKTNNSTPSGTQLPGSVALINDTSTGASTTTVIIVTTGGLVVNAHVGRWLQIGTTKRRITANTANIITVSPGFLVAPPITTPVKILKSEIVLTSKDWGEHTNQVSVEVEAGAGNGFVATLGFEDTVEQSSEIGGTSYLNVKYVGGPPTATGTVAKQSPYTDGSTFAVTTGSAPLLNAWADMVLKFANGLQRLILSNTAADPSTVVLATGHYLTSDENTEIDGTSVTIANVTSATVSITGANGEATGLTSVVAPTADNLNITFSEGMTLRQLVDYLNGSTNYEAVIPDGVNQDTTLMSSFDFGTRNTTVDVMFDDEISPSIKGSFRRDLQVLVDWVNTFSTLATAEKADTATTEGAGLPDWTGGVYGTARDVPVYFIGGTRGHSHNSDFQAGFDALIQQRGNHIVPLISENLVNEGFSSDATIASVAAQLRAHVGLCRTTGKNEMGGYLGFKGDIDDVLAQAAALNDTDVQLIPQQMSFLDSNNELTLLPEWAAAVAAAGMRSGALEVGEPLTFKFIKTTQLTQDNSWSPRSITDINRLIQGGVMFAEQLQNGTIRWVRDITTHLADDNTAYIDGNSREAVRYVAYDLRKSLEDTFTGLKATPATVASIREYVAAKMAEYLSLNIIVESLDPETRTVRIPGYRYLRVFIEGNVATIRVEVFICTGIVFQLNDIKLQLPILAA